MPEKSETKGRLMAKLTDGSYVEIAEGISLEEAETITEDYEFVRVVRCKDCKWYERSRLKKDGTDDMRYARDFCTWHRIWSPAEYYCADGERRDG